jgi:hypothetical protein
MLLSSRVVFDQLIRGPAMSDIGNGIGFLPYSGGYDLAFDLRGNAGGIDHNFIHEYKVRNGDFDAVFEAGLYSRFSQDVGGAPLIIRALGEQVEFVWNKKYVHKFKRVIHWSTGDEWNEGDLHFVCNYSVKFDVVLNRDTGAVSFTRNAETAAFNVSITGYEHLFDLKWEGINMEKKLIDFFKPKLYAILEKLTTPTIETFLLRNLLFPNHNALQLTDAFIPGDLAVFGQIDPLRTTTVLAPLNKTIGAGETLQFSLTPMPDDVQWAAVDVDGHMLLPDAISTTGLFTAPSKLTDGFVAVMVTAKGTLNNLPVQSSALVTVLQSATVTNPMYNSCDIGKSLELSAQSLGDTPLVWDIKTKQWGSSLGAEDPAKPGFRQYTAGTNMDPDVPFPIDIIEVKNTADNTVSYIYIMLKKTLVVVPLALHESSDPVKGTIKFQMLGNNGQPIVPTPGVTTVTWELLHGNGELDEETGIYTEPNTVVPGSFVVISAVADFSGVMQLHGRTAIPLPLRKYAELIGAVNNTVLNS